MNIAAELRRILDEWNLTRKVNFAVTDNAANITNAIKDHLGWKHYGCYAHTLNLVLQDSLQEFKDSLAKVKRIRSWLFPQKYFCYRKTEPGADIERQNTETSDPRSRN